MKRALKFLKMSEKWEENSVMITGLIESIIEEVPTISTETIISRIYQSKIFRSNISVLKMAFQALNNTYQIINPNDPDDRICFLIYKHNSVTIYLALVGNKLTFNKGDINLIPIDQVSYFIILSQPLNQLQNRLLISLFSYLEQKDPNNLDQNNRILSTIVGTSLARIFFKLFSPSLFLVYDSLFREGSFQEILKILIFLRVHNFDFSIDQIKGVLEAKLGEKQAHNINPGTDKVSYDDILTNFLDRVEKLSKSSETSNLLYEFST